MPDVLVIDDSATARLAMRRAIESQPSELRVVGEARNGAEAMARLRELSPDVVTMDVHLEGEDGCELAAAIMEARPVPIVLVTAVDPRAPGLSFRALQAGALDVLPKPPGPRSPHYAAACRQLVRALTSFAGVPLVRRKNRLITPYRNPTLDRAGPIDLVVIGASTGGPPLLSKLLAGAGELAVPIAIVQHIAEGFGAGLARWLAEATGRRVRTCTRAERLAPGEVLLAPDDRHLRLVASDTIAPVEGAPRRFQRPSIDELFESVAALRAPSTLAVLLTGMGDDGAAGLSALRRAGARTVAQAPSSCVVDAMPRAAIQRDAAERVLSPEDIRALLAELRAGPLRAPGGALRGDEP